MKRKLLGFAALAFLVPAVALAQTYGTVSGKVVDADGKPLQGATIRLAGTTQGAKSKSDGSFIIAGVRAGEYEIDASYVGFQPFKAAISVSINQNTSVTIKMSTKPLSGKEIIVNGNSPIAIRPEKPGTVHERSGREIENSSRTSIISAVALSSGVTTQGVNGFAIRGGRATETSFRVDGIDIGDPFTGGFGNTSASLYPTVSPLAVEQVQVQTSGFGPEFGNILSGAVNSVTRSGSRDHYEGSFRFRTGVPALYGSSSPITVKKVGTDIDTTLPGAKLSGSGSKLYEFGFGGPIPGFDKLTFYITGKYNSIPYSGASYDVYDMSDEFARQRAPIAQQVWGLSLTPTNLGQLPHQLAMVRDINGKFRLAVTDDIFVEFGGEIGLTSSESGAWTNIYQLDHPTFADGSVNQNILERDAQQINSNTIIDRANIRYFQNLNQGTYFEVLGSWVRNRYEAGKKDESKKYGMFDAFDIYGLDDKNNDIVIDRYALPEAELTLNQYLGQTVSGFGRNPITGLYEGGEVGGASRNPYGLIDNGNFPVHGNDRTLEIRESTVLNLKGNYETNFDMGDVKTQLKAGVELKQSTLSRNMNSLPWDPNPFFDVYGYDALYFAQSDTTGTLRDFFSKPYKPLEGALYVGARFDYKSIVFQPGVRFDFIDPNTKVPPSSRGSIGQVVEGLKNAPNASLKFQVSPRIGVSYPVTDNSMFRVNFGVMFKMPDYNDLYDNAFGDAQRGNQLFGNPNVEPQKAFIYEMGYEAKIADEYYLDIAAFYRDIYNQSGVTYVPAIPSPYIVYSVTDYGNVRGIEISARKALSNNISAELNYTIQKAVGTASSPEANYSTLIGSVDPYTGEQQKLPLTEYPLNYDQTHALNATVNFIWGKGEGPTVGGLKLLENSTIGITATFNSGLPYTRETEKGQPTTEFNSQRYPSQFNTEAHLERGFRLADLFGESVGNLEVSFFADVYNLLNLTPAIAIRLSRAPGGSRYSITGSPDNDGLAMNRQIGDFIATPHYRDIDPNRPETWDAQQYDAFGTRYYNPYADANLDGVVTQLERYEGYQRYITTIQTLRSQYATPRTVSVGVRLRF
ncbi:MAG: TonB-dependent receptor [Bacteroidetes bacterium]|nr:TonB-dependent receptor [Bacteroidota bacterium]